MTITYMPVTSPEYRALSTDMTSGSKIPGVSWIGAKIYFTDTKSWGVVLPDETIVPMYTTSASPITIAGGTIVSTGSMVVTSGSINSVVSGSVTVLASENHIGEIGGKMTTVAVEFTRENNATPYTAGDVISSGSALTTPIEMPNIFRVSGGSGYVVNARVTFNVKSVTPRLRLHFFSGSAITIAGDNLAYVEKYADASSRLGMIDFDAMTTGTDATNSDMSRSLNISDRLGVIGATRSLWVVVQTLDAVTLTALSKVLVTVTLDNN